MNFFIFLKKNSRYLCKIIIFTNLFVFLYFCTSFEKEPFAKLFTYEYSNLDIQDYKFKDFKLEKWNETQKFELEDSKKTFFKWESNIRIYASYIIHFRKVGSSQCYLLGTNFNASTSGCVCKEKYFGAHCGIPGNLKWLPPLKQRYLQKVHGKVTSR